MLLLLVVLLLFVVVVVVDGSGSVVGNSFLHMNSVTYNLHTF